MIVQNAWKHFNILECVESVAEVLEELQPETLNGCWKKIWPEVEPEVQRIIAAAHKIPDEDFQEIGTSDVEELLADPELSEEDAIALATGNENLENLSSDDVRTGHQIGRTFSQKKL
jgi:hypothetical protein